MAAIFAILGGILAGAWAFSDGQFFLPALISVGLLSGMYSWLTAVHDIAFDGKGVLHTRSILRKRDVAINDVVAIKPVWRNWSKGTLGGRAGAMSWGLGCRLRDSHGGRQETPPVGGRGVYDFLHVLGTARPDLNIDESFRSKRLERSSGKSGFSFG
jgi:hypothetical protein